MYVTQKCEASTIGIKCEFGDRVSSSLRVIKIIKDSYDLNLNQPLSREQVSEQVREQIETILKMLAGAPKELLVVAIHGERTIVFKVTCNRQDIGRILGSKGKMITSIRNVSSALTAKHGYRSIVEVPYFPVNE